MHRYIRQLTVKQWKFVRKLTCERSGEDAYRYRVHWRYDSCLYAADLDCLRSDQWLDRLRHVVGGKALVVAVKTE